MEGNSSSTLETSLIFFGLAKKARPIMRPPMKGKSMSKEIKTPITEPDMTDEELAARENNEVDTKKLVKRIALQVVLPVAAVVVTHIVMKKVLKSDSPAEITN